MTGSENPPRGGEPHNEESIRRALLRADSALGAAGLAVSDPAIRELGRQIAAGKITGNEAAAQIIEAIRPDAV